MPYKVFITGSGISKKALKILEQENCEFQTGDPKDSPADIATKLKSFNPDGMIVRQGNISGDVMDAAPNLKVISKHGVGTDNIDIEAASMRNIPVFYTPNANFESAAEHTLALIMALIRKVTEQDNKIRGGIFDKKDYDGIELKGKTLGIIGFGRIGRRLTELLTPFKVKVLVHHPKHIQKQLPSYVTKVKEVQHIYKEADIISLHCPLNEKTKGMINTKTISQMKSEVYIINTSRGGVINENDLIDALKNGKIKGAALDVFENEPLETNSPLSGLHNVILTTHIAGISDNSFDNMGISSVNNILSVLKGTEYDDESLLNKNIV